MMDPRLKTGLELFNQKKYFECHEEIEKLWLETHDNYRNLYKGLIQAAAALYQARREIRGGASRLYKSSANYLLAYEPEALGLNIKKFIHDLERWFQAWEKEGQFTQTELERMLPTIEFREFKKKD